jgi:tRNA(adenine34) deaminase
MGQEGEGEDVRWMRLALDLARRAGEEQEVPVGAVLVAADGRVTGRGRNRREAAHDPTHHAEIEAIREAAGWLGSWRLDGATLYATLEPCAMCAGAAVNARVSRIVFGCPDPKGGYCGSIGNIPREERLNHRPEVRGGVLAEECGAILKDFFRAKR